MTVDKVLTQARRLLQDRRSEAFASEFASQWLSLDKLVEDGGTAQALNRAMRQETVQFFTAIVHEDRSVLEFLDADYTFLNETLAKHYGIDGVHGVHGEHMRRVRLSGRDQRGGLLTQASFLKLTSSGNDTSPVLRGKWVLENLLAAAPLRPPLAVVEALQNIPKHNGPSSRRQQLDQHRANPSCAECHARMDTIGLALEYFGPSGAWRLELGDRPIETGGTLPDGEALNNPADVKAYLLKHRKEFVRALSERLLAYALNRKLTDSDRAALAHVPDRVAAHDYRFSQVVLEVAQSEPFLAGWSGVIDK